MSVSEKITNMTGEEPIRRRITPRASIGLVVVLGVIALLSAFLRFEGLGARSLWADELSTWHVSRMEVGASLRWGPELTKPPLYQFALRALTRDPRPTEATLRLPAALCGLLAVAAGCWLGRLAGGWPVGLAMALLLAVNALQVEYSREARPYSMLVLACTVSTICWYRLVTDPCRLRLPAYVTATVLGLYVHYLVVLTVAAQVIWYAVILSRRPSARRSWRPLLGPLVSGILCAPLVLRYWHYRSSLFQGLEWISSPTLGGTWQILGDLTFGWPWMLGLLVPVVLLWMLPTLGFGLEWCRSAGAATIAEGAEDVCGLLLSWCLCGTLGLLVISWLAQPAMVARYALPAAVPMLLFPLTVVYRLHRHAPLVIAVVFALAAIPAWSDRSEAPGCREMVRYFDREATKDSAAVVLAIDAPPAPGWEGLDRLPFQYYPLRHAPLLELPLDTSGRPVDDRVLRDPRALFLVVFRSEPSRIIKGTGRRLASIFVDGESFSRLLFAPYRVALVAPLADD